MGRGIRNQENMVFVSLYAVVAWLLEKQKEKLL